jgi:copper chaperone CopZ
MLIGSSIYAHEKADTIKVNGDNCEAYKLQIEKVLKINGITRAEWNVKTKLLIVTYSSHAVRNINIQKKIAEAGYDTEKSWLQMKLIISWKHVAGAAKNKSSRILLISGIKMSTPSWFASILGG